MASQQQLPEPAPMSPASLQHTIVRTHDTDATAGLLSAVAGLRVGERWHSFVPLFTKNNITLDLLQVPEAGSSIAPQHYAFLTDDAGFDAGLAALKSRDVGFWAHHTGAGKGKINTLYGGRGLYFRDEASGHNIELMTVVYGDPREVDEALEKLKLEEEGENEEREGTAEAEEEEEEKREE